MGRDTPQGAWRPAERAAHKFVCYSLAQHQLNRRWRIWCAVLGDMATSGERADDAGKARRRISLTLFITPQAGRRGNLDQSQPAPRGWGLGQQHNRERNRLRLITQAGEQAVAIHQRLRDFEITRRRQWSRGKSLPICDGGPRRVDFLILAHRPLPQKFQKTKIPISVPEMF